jgi:hypothetical protein
MKDRTTEKICNCVVSPFFISSILAAYIRYFFQDFTFGYWIFASSLVRVDKEERSKSVFIYFRCRDTFCMRWYKWVYWLFQWINRIFLWRWYIFKGTATKHGVQLFYLRAKYIRTNNITLLAKSYLNLYRLIIQLSFKKPEWILKTYAVFMLHLKSNKGSSMIIAWNENPNISHLFFFALIDFLCTM